MDIIGGGSEKYELVRNRNRKSAESELTWNQSSIFLRNENSTRITSEFVTGQ